MVLFQKKDVMKNFRQKVNINIFEKKLHLKKNSFRQTFWKTKANKFFIEQLQCNTMTEITRILPLQRFKSFLQKPKYPLPGKMESVFLKISDMHTEFKLF